MTDLKELNESIDIKLGYINKMIRELPKDNPLILDLQKEENIIKHSKLVLNNEKSLTVFSEKLDSILSNQDRYINYTSENFDKYVNEKLKSTLEKIGQEQDEKLNLVVRGRLKYIESPSLRLWDNIGIMTISFIVIVSIIGGMLLSSWVNIN